MHHPPFGKYGYIWVTLTFFLLSFIGHWAFGWMHYVHEQEDHGQPIEARDFVNKTLAETFENWQSEFLQLIWQVAGLAFLLYVGSPQSKEGDNRLEEKIDFLVEHVGKEKGTQFLKKTDERFART
jgi:hypothetical protein